MSFNRTRMELKLANRQEKMAARRAFNRTRMELKHSTAFFVDNYLYPFNRTRMELKLRNDFSAMATGEAFNRTRMELKLFTLDGRQKYRRLLIVPEWN